MDRCPLTSSPLQRHGIVTREDLQEVARSALVKESESKVPTLICRAALGVVAMEHTAIFQVDRVTCCIGVTLGVEEFLEHMWEVKLVNVPCQHFKSFGMFWFYWMDIVSMAPVKQGMSTCHAEK
jgi:hypothetical protein